MQTKRLPKADATEPAPSAPSKRTRASAAKKPASADASKEVLAGKESKSVSPAEAVKPKRAKFKKYTHTMPENEHDAILELKQKLKDGDGTKAKKSALIRAAMRVFVAMPITKIKAALNGLEDAAPGK
ncbi:MAG: hypothetical protein K2X55_24125 [Burkholderiaceae bacterium]|nr:hypothetical protein [Burkholderiaceae bacterium]